MKKAILIMMAVIIPLLSSAQTSPLQAIFDKYSGREDYTSVYVTRAMFELFESIANDKEDKEFKEITSKLTSIKILSFEPKTKANPGNGFYKEMVRTLTAPYYEELMIINDGGEEIKFVIRKSGDKISELIMILGGSDACLIALEGDIYLKQVAKLSKSMNLKGFEHLNNVSTKSK